MAGGTPRGVVASDGSRAHGATINHRGANVGQEVRCTVEYEAQLIDGKAHLDTDELLFRGDVRLRIPFGDMRSVHASDGKLAVQFSGGEATFDLGPAAEKWAARIRNPPSRLQKLGVKPGTRISVVGPHDAAFVSELGAATDAVSVGETLADSDLIFLGAETRDDLKQLWPLQSFLRPNGALWVIRPKGVAAVTERDVLETAKAAGLVDVKVARFSATHTAEKLVIPVARRQPLEQALVIQRGQRVGKGGDGLVHILIGVGQ